MKIKFKENENDPPYPYVVGDSPFAKVFNQREKEFFEAHPQKEYIQNNWTAQDWRDQVLDMGFSILMEDYNNRHTVKK